MTVPALRSTALCLALAAISTAALAEAPKEKEWSARITPYLWLPAINGDMSYKGQSNGISASIQDVLSNFGGAVFLNGAFEWRRFLVLGDFMWARLTDDVTSQKVSVGSLPIEAGPLSADITLNEYSFALSAGYRVLDMLFPGVTDGGAANDPRRLHVDAYVGGRYWYIDQRIDLSVPPATVGGTPIPGGGRNVRVDPNDWWVDLQLGMLIGLRPWQRWSFGLGGAIGGFGIGSSSDFSWQASLLGNWHFGERWSLNLAYRGLGFDRRFGSGSEDLSLNLAQHGPLLGITYQF
jgi:hypothetical protein